MRKLAGILFIDWRGRVELLAVVLVSAAFLLATGADNFEETLSVKNRRALYGALASTSGALLGFVLAALAILVALPSTERLDALKKHPRWERVPSAYFRAARALLAALVISLLGIALDSASEPWRIWEVIAVAVLGLALIRVSAAIVALDQIVSVVRASQAKKRIDDPGA